MNPRKFLAASIVAVYLITLGSCGGSSTVSPYAAPETPASIAMQPTAQMLERAVLVAKIVPANFIQQMRLAKPIGNIELPTSTPSAPGAAPSQPLQSPSGTITAQALDVIAGQRLVFSGLDSSRIPWKTNDVLVAGITDRTPFGLLRRVTDVKNTPAGAEIATEQAKLEDVIADGVISDNGSLVPAERARLVHEPNGGLVRVMYEPPKEEIVFTLKDVPLGAGVVANGEARIKPSFDFNVRIASAHIDAIEFHNMIEIHSSITVTAGYEDASKNEAVLLDTIPFKPHEKAVGSEGLPVVLTPLLRVYVGLDGKVFAGVITTVADEATLDLRLRYDGSTWSYQAPYPTNSFSFERPTISAKIEASAKVFLRPRIDLLIYGVVGPYAEMESYLSLKVAPTALPWWTLRAGITACMGVELTLFKFLTVSYATKTITLLDIPLAQAPSEAANPGPGAASAWPMAGHDSGNTHWSREETVLHPPLRVIWQYKPPDNIDLFETATIDSGKVLLSGTANNQQSHVVVGLDAEFGNRLWRFDLTGGAGSMGSQPAVAHGLAFFGGQSDDRLYAVDVETGQLRWQRSGMVSMYGLNPIVDRGVLYVSTWGGAPLSVVAIDADGGKTLWELKGEARQSDYVLERGMLLRGGVYGEPIIAADSGSGGIIWRTPGRANGDLVAGEGFVFAPYTGDTPVGLSDYPYYVYDRLAAFSVGDGLKAWEINLNTALTHARLAYSGDALYLLAWDQSSAGSSLYVFDPATGQALNQRRFDARYYQIVGANNVVYLCGEGLQAVETGTLTTLWDAGIGSCNDAAIAGHRLYVIQPWSEGLVVFGQ